MHPVLVLCVGHEVFAELRLLVLPLVGRQLVTHVDLVPDLPAEVAGDDDLLARRLVLLHRAGQFKPERNTLYDNNINKLCALLKKAMKILILFS